MNDFKEQLEILEIIKSKILLPLTGLTIDWSSSKNIKKLLSLIGFKDDYPYFIFNIDEERIYEIMFINTKSEREVKEDFIYFPLSYLHKADEEDGLLEFEDFLSYKKGLDRFNTFYDLCFQSLKNFFGQVQYIGSYISKRGNKFNYNQDYKYAVWQMNNSCFVLQQDMVDDLFRDDIGLIIISSEKSKDFNNLPVSRLIGIGNI